MMPSVPGRTPIIRARRGHSIAIVASARKLACLFWCLLTRGEDYAFAHRPTEKKMRRLELQAGAARWQGARHVWSTKRPMPTAERDLALQAQRAYERTIKEPPPDGRERDTGPRISWLLKRASRAADAKAQVCGLTRRRPRPTQLSHRSRPSNPLDLHPSSIATVVRRRASAAAPCPERERHGLPADRSVAVPELLRELVVAALGCRRRGVVSATLLLGGLALAFGLAFQALAFGTDALVCLADDSIQELLQTQKPSQAGPR